MFRVFHPIPTQYTVFSAAHGTFCKIYHILGQKGSLSKYKKIEITPCILSDHNALKLELNNKNNLKNCANNWRLNNKYIAQRSLGHSRNNRGNKKVPGSS
jgi:hypothetical protein